MTDVEAVVPVIFAVIDWGPDLIKLDKVAMVSGQFDGFDEGKYYDPGLPFDRTDAYLAIQNKFPGNLVHFRMAWFDNMGLFQWWRRQELGYLFGVENIRRGWDKLLKRSNIPRPTKEKGRISRLGLESMGNVFGALVSVLGVIVVVFCAEWGIHGRNVHHFDNN